MLACVLLLLRVVSALDCLLLQLIVLPGFGWLALLGTAAVILVPFFGSASMSKKENKAL